MPFSPLHKIKRSKNLALLLILLGMIALFFTLTIVRLGE